MNPRILIVDDEERMAQTLARVLGRCGYETACAGDGQDALERLENGGFDLVVTDLKMPRLDGLELLRAAEALRPRPPVIVMTAYADVPSAVDAMRAGAYDYVAKPFDNETMRRAVARALEVAQLRRENRFLRRSLGRHFDPDSLVAESAASRELLALVRRVAASRSTALVQGPSGTGKEFVARLLHYWSDRVGGPFVAVNCAALAEGVLESELFGHEKGAFTGAIRSRAGCFERAHGGTLFLDEIGEVSGDFQAKLLRVLQEGEVQRVGSGEVRAVDVRLVAASNRNLRDAVAAGRFREDLYFRLAVIPIELRPLRERREDILPLADLFLQRYGSGHSLSEGASAALRGHDWPGNVRELENAVERAVVLARGDVLESEDFLLDGDCGAEAVGDTLQEAVDAATRQAIHAALDASGGQRQEAADRLGIDRTTLYRLMKRFEID